MRKLLLAFVVFTSACSEKPAPSSAAPVPANLPAVPAPAAAPSAALSEAGIGALRFGMKLAEAEAALGSKAVLPEPIDPACSMVRFPSLPKLRFMVENSIVTRADADAGVANALGVKVGDTLEQVRSRYPAATVSPHKYDPNGHYVTFPSADGRAAVILEVVADKVAKIRAGLQPAVAYVETCG